MEDARQTFWNVEGEMEMSLCNGSGSDVNELGPIGEYIYIVPRLLVALTVGSKFAAASTTNANLRTINNTRLNYISRSSISLTLERRLLTESCLPSASQNRSTAPSTKVNVCLTNV
jgi:hypothetical protein